MTSCNQPTLTNFLHVDENSVFFSDLLQLQESLRILNMTIAPEARQKIQERLMLALENTISRGTILIEESQKDALAYPARYKVEDKVFYLKDYKIVSGYVQQVIVCYYAKHGQPYASYWVDKVNKEGNLLREDILFSSKEELLAHLAKA